LVGPSLPAATAKRLRGRGIAVTSTRDLTRPFAAAPDADLLLVLSARTIVEPAAVRQFLGNLDLAPGEAALVIDDHPDATPRAVRAVDDRVTNVMCDGNCASLNLAVLSRGAADRVRRTPTLLQALQHLAQDGQLRPSSVAPSFCARLDGGAKVAELERRYLEQTNSGSRAGIITRSMRGFSVPLSRRLVHLPLTANH